MLNDIVKVRLKTAKPLVFDNYQNNRATGAFILINENTCNTVAAGMVSAESQTEIGDFSTAVEDFQSLVKAGKTLEAIEKYYADDIQIQENSDAPRVGKQAMLQREKGLLGQIKSIKFDILSSVIDEAKGWVLGEMQIDYETLTGYTKQINEAFVQHWKGGKVVFERFYYK